MTLFKEGQILFGRRNWYLRRVAIADFDGICSGDIYVLESIEGKIIKDFLPILMHSDEFFEKNMMYSHGSMSTRVKWSNLANLEFTIPSIHDQKSILSLINQIDDVILKTQNLLEKSQIYLISKRELLLTKGIDHTIFKKVKWHYGKKIEIPQSWEIKKLDDLCSMITDGSHRSPKSTMEGYPFAAVEHINNSKIDIASCPKISKKDYDDLVKNNCKPKKHDVLFTKDGTVGVSFVFQQNTKLVLLSSIAIIRTNSSLDPFFGNYSLQSEFLKKHLKTFVGGTALKRIILTDLRSYQFPLPPLHEQKQIISILIKIDEQIKQIENHLLKLKTMRKSILNSKLTTREKQIVIN